MKKEVENRTSLSIWTDLYQINTLAAFFINRTNVRASFELYVEKLPPNRNYLIAAGLQQVIEYLSGVGFNENDIQFLKTIPGFSNIPDEFFAFLKEFRFTGDVWAIPEGTPFFAEEPVLRITAPITEAQFVESYILSVINYQITVASKASRIVESAQGKQVIDFGFRRAPTPEAAHLASRAAYIAGFDATSNLEAGRRYGISLIATIPYSFVLAFETEQDALKKYAKAFPNGALVLIDAFNTAEATREVIACGEKLKGVRISSGELLKLSQNVRKILNEANHHETKIIASGELDEFKISTLTKANAPIDYFGVGAGLVSMSDSPMVEGIYRLVEIEEKGKVRYPVKFSRGKETIPGRKQILRKFNRHGKYVGDRIAKAGEIPADNEIAYMRKIMENGKIISPLPSLKEIRKYCLEEVSKLPHEVKKINRPVSYPVIMTPALKNLNKSIQNKKQNRRI